MSRLPAFGLVLISVFFWTATVFSQSEAQAIEWDMDQAASKLEFVVKAQNNPVRGAFQTFTASIVLDPEQAETGSILVSIDTGSVSTGTDQADTLAASAAWLNIGEFPKAVFKSTKIRKVDGNRFRASGTLTIKDNSVPVDLDFALTIDGHAAVAIGSTSFARTDLGIGAPYSDSLPIDDEVLIDFTISATRR